MGGFLCIRPKKYAKDRDWHIKLYLDGFGAGASGKKKPDRQLMTLAWFSDGYYEGLKQREAIEKRMKKSSAEIRSDRWTS